MSTELSIHNVSSIDLQRHIFDGFHNTDLTIRTEGGDTIKITLYSHSGEITIAEGCPVEDHRKAAA